MSTLKNMAVPSTRSPVSDPLSHNATIHRWTIVVRGVVQGVGFRPFVYNTARAMGLAGWVQNEADMVRIEAQGPAADLEGFCNALRDRHPPAARIDAVDVIRSPATENRQEPFCIRSSDGGGSPRPTIPADLATCPACREEIATAGERRYQYPFTNCTNCGPRWSIIAALPYDRPRTAMAGFAMCPACESEYRDPSDRRFHAQPIACPQCGPRLELLDAAGKRLGVGPEALEGAARAVCEGRILALKGLGGFQLVADAANGRAVVQLRERKHRPDKPFAVMLSSLEEIRARCEICEDEACVLESPESPILLLHRRRRERAAVDDIAEEVAPGNPYLGVMLPYTPLHHLLMGRIGRAIVCTSGNLSEEPMAVCAEDALARLGPIADVFLVHDRPIVRPVDDSVARLAADGLQLLRRARGYAPLPIDLGRPGPTVLAVGGHLKNTVALALGSQVVLSQHVGDLDNVASVEVHQRTIRDLLDFFRVVPEGIACDLHPDYASTRCAEALAAQWGVPLVRVQHHFAHVAACMAEHRLAGPVLGFSWDGTGYGADGTVWGGEALECRSLALPSRASGGVEPGSLLPLGSGEPSYRRIAHLRTFALPGGDRAVREPRRSALGLLFEVFGAEAAQYAGGWFSEEELRGLLRLLARPRLCPRTSSMGRLFDAVAVIGRLGLRPNVVSVGTESQPTQGRHVENVPHITFEGQAAMALEFAAEEDCEEAYPFALADGPSCTAAVADWEPAIRAILADRAAGVPAGRISARFHNGLADLAVVIARRWGGADVVLSGGCFQNSLLVRRVRERLLAAGFRVHSHRLVPPNDGGIALGQAAVAARIIRQGNPSCA